MHYSTYPSERKCAGKQKGAATRLAFIPLHKPFPDAPVPVHRLFVCESTLEGLAHNPVGTADINRTSEVNGFDTRPSTVINGFLMECK